MRLGTCIALELVVAAGAAGGVWFGVGHAVRIAGASLATSEAVAATARLPMPMPTPTRLPRAHLDVEVVPPAVTSVFGRSDDELLAPLTGTKVTRLKANRGGTSLSLRLDFASGARAAFKPEQIHPQSDPRREIAAYRLDRLLEIGRVPPAVATSISIEELLSAAEPSHRTYMASRLAEEAIVRGGVVRGELSWWVPELLVAKLGPHHVDEKDGKLLWTAYLQAGASIPDDARPLVEQIAAVVLFDVLIDNPDRWSGGNTRMSPDGSILYFMDNTMSFSTFEFGHESNLLALRRIQVFPRGLVARMRALTLEVLVRTLRVGDDHGLAPLLDDAELHAILVRRDNMLRHVDRLIADHGEAAVLALP